MAKPETTKPPATPTAPPAAAKPPAPAAAAAKAVIPTRALSPLISARWSEAQFKQARHAIAPEAGTPFEHLFNPAYYAHIAPKVNAGDILEARPADGAYFAEIYVWSKGANWLQVSLLHRIDRPAPVALPSLSKAFSIDFVDGPAQHRVIRNSDGAVMAENFTSPEAANSWLGQNHGRLAA